jgi:hypothetical protein
MVVATKEEKLESINMRHQITVGRRDNRNILPDVCTYIPGNYPLFSEDPGRCGEEENGCFSIVRFPFPSVSCLHLQQPRQESFVAILFTYPL